MKSLYIESSAILTWLFGEPKSNKVVSRLNTSGIVLSSVLSILETERTLLRAEHQQMITSADRQIIRGIFVSEISGWSFIEITSSIRMRAAQSFPIEPIRSLDAIHLATMLECLQLYPDIKILSFDNRIMNNITPLGLVFAA